MWIYLFFLIIGGLLGYFLREKPVDKISKILLNISVLILLFFMGVGIGKDPDLNNKIINFGIKSITITFFTVSMSILSVFFIVKIFGRKD
ncbi:MAG: lysine exporter LysO family protein [Deferribacterales bacterium]